VVGTFQSRANGGDAAIHHVAGRDDVGAGIGLIQALTHQRFHRGIVQHIASVVDQPVLPMRGVGIERHIGQNADIVAAGVLDGANGAAHQIVRIERFLAILAAALLLGVGEQGEAGDAEAHRLLRALHHQIDAPARDAGQAGDGVFHALAIGHEQRPDEVGGVRMVSRCIARLQGWSGCGGGAGRGRGR
jgi:hypothetical protein